MTRKNLHKPLLADDIDVIAWNQSYQAGEAYALSVDARNGFESAKVGPNGLMTEDFVHLLVHGERDFGAIVRETAFYDPVLDEVFLIQPDEANGTVVITKGFLDADTRLSESEDRRVQLMGWAVDYAANAYDRDIDVVSRWTVALVCEGARLLLKEGIANLEATRVVSADPASIWQALGDMWLSQPWGLDENPIDLGALA